MQKNPSSDEYTQCSDLGFSYHFPLKDQGLLRAMEESMAEAGNVLQDPGTSCYVPENKEMF